MKYIDVTGKRFGELTVLRRVGSSSPVMLECRCDCGNTVTVRKSNLTSGNTQSCGHNRKFLDDSDKTVRHDFTGQTFGYWTVLEKAGTRYSKTGKSRTSMWRCLCKCGTERDVNGGALLSGRSRSCGCLCKEVVSKITTEDLTGKQFGHLTVLERAGSRRPCESSSLRAVWKCLCACGNIKLSTGELLKSGDCTSCGCKNISSLEYSVLTYLGSKGMAEGIDYECQKTYPDLLGIGGKQLRYDFLIYKDGIPFCLIECQGMQHYKSVEYFGGDVTYHRNLVHDMKKRQYAERIGLPLFEIDYRNTEYEMVASLLRQFGV